jgi:hypothetical protein
VVWRRHPRIVECPSWHRFDNVEATSSTHQRDFDSEICMWLRFCKVCCRGLPPRMNVPLRSQAVLGLLSSSRLTVSRQPMSSDPGRDVQLRIPKLHKGSFFPVILEPRRRIDQALYAVMEAHVRSASHRAFRSRRALRHSSH